jgi:hypothetical protein
LKEKAEKEKRRSNRLPDSLDDPDTDDGLLVIIMISIKLKATLFTIMMASILALLYRQSSKLPI